MIKKFFSSEFFRGSIVLLIMFNLFNFLNFVFHFLMARMLGPADYGVLAVLMSIVYVYNVPTEAIQSLVSRYVSKFNLTGEKGKIKYLIEKAFSKGSILGFQLFLVSIIVAVLLSEFLGVNFWLFFVTNVFIFISIFSPLARGSLQGRKKFFSLGVSMNIESLSKIICSVLLVYFGFRAFGAITGALIGCVAGFVIAVYFNKDVFKSESKGADFNGIYKQSMPYFISMFVVFIVLSMDIILAKRFFSAEVAGQYSVLSMLGKMIFFGTMAVSKAMFPLTSEKSDSQEDSSHLFKKALGLVLVLCAGALMIYFFIPKLFIFVLYGEQYVSMAPYLIYSGIALSFLSLTNLILIYALSTNKLRKPELLIIFIFVQIGLFYFFHGSVLEYILAFMFSNIVMFIGALFLIKR